MVNPERESIGGEYTVEVDETLVGGRTKGEGHGVHHKATVVGAVEVRVRKDGEDRAATGHNTHEDGKPLKSKIYAGRLRLQVVPDKKAVTLTNFIKSNIVDGTKIKTDGGEGYNGLSSLGYKHEALVVNKNPELIDAHLPLIHLIFSNLKSWIIGTHHGVSQDHLQNYLDEYVFRFNRRFYPMTSFNSVLGLAVKCESPTYEEFYSGDWAKSIPF
jgi:transposase-like protein